MVNVKDVQLGTTTRKSFAKINEVMPMPNLCLLYTSDAADE